MSKDQYDIFVNNRLYTDATKIFQTVVLSIGDIKDRCIFVLDTNALLLPYATGSEGLVEIEKIYAKMKAENRLKIPGQVAREFAKNRPEKLKEFFSKVSKKHNQIQPYKIENYPLLHNNSQYEVIRGLESDLNQKISEYRNAFNDLLNYIKNWTWNDPISIMYQKIFTPEIIIEIAVDEADFKKDLDYRYLHKIPPGFKDSNKPDDGIGDLLIWKTILEIGKAGNDVIFVSGDEKNDWYHVSEKQGLYPRFELIAEFNKLSGGKSFHIMKLSELLALFGAQETIIMEVANEEDLSRRINDIINNISDKYMGPEYATVDYKLIVDWLLSEEQATIITQTKFPSFTTYHDKSAINAYHVISINLVELTPVMFINYKRRIMEDYSGLLHSEMGYNKITMIVITDKTDEVFISKMLEYKGLKSILRNNDELKLARVVNGTHIEFLS